MCLTDEQLQVIFERFPNYHIDPKPSFYTQDILQVLFGLGLIKFVGYDIILIKYTKTIRTYFMCYQR